MLELEAYAGAAHPRRQLKGKARKLTTTPTRGSASSPSKLLLRCSFHALELLRAARVNMKRLSLVAFAASLASVQSEGLDIDAVNPKIVEAQ